MYGHAQPRLRKGSVVGDGRDIEKGRAVRPLEVGGTAPGAKPRLNIRSTLSKLFFDSITVGAAVNTVLFLVLMGIMKGQSLESIGQNLRTVSSCGLLFIWECIRWDGS